MPLKVCQTCGKEYQTNKLYSKKQIQASKYCSNYCKQRRYREIKVETKICHYCKNEYSINRKFSIKQKDNSKYCSINCCNQNTLLNYTPRLPKAKKPKLYLTKEEISFNIRAGMNKPDVKEKLRILNSRKRSPMSLETRIKHSDILAGKMPANLNDKKYGNIKRGVYDINGKEIYFRSKWEANYALYLDFLIKQGEISKWEFEPKCFMFDKIKLGTRSYRPDFAVYTNDNKVEWHEVKGYMDSKSKTKIKRFKKYYPSEKLILIDKKYYKELSKWSKILNWY